MKKAVLACIIAAALRLRPHPYEFFLYYDI